MKKKGDEKKGMRKDGFKNQPKIIISKTRKVGKSKLDLIYTSNSARLLVRD